LLKWEVESGKWRMKKEEAVLTGIAKETATA
jgi:hypothetical protein